MKDELDRQLCERYPKIFADRHGDVKSTLMCWGFECGDGWYNILYTLCGAIQCYIDNNPHLNVPQVVAVQVKEKFGTLRFYVNGGDDYTQGMIALAEHFSARTCEQCGASGKLRGRGWFYVACDEHTRPEDLLTDTETDTEEDI